MSNAQRNARQLETHHRLDVLTALRGDLHHSAAEVTPAGAEWLASADPFPRDRLALWSARPTAPGVLPCGTLFDVVNAPIVFGRRMVDRLWSDGPGTGPVAVHRGRMLIFAAPGTAHRLPALLDWMGDPPTRPGGRRADAVPPLLCHGTGDAVTVPPLHAPSGPPREGGDPAAERAVSRWLVAPDGRHPWLPGTQVLLWACVQAARGGAAAAERGRESAETALAPV